MSRALSSRPYLERRSKPRVSTPFRAAVQGTDVNGVHFDVTATLDNLSAGGLYLRLASEVRVGSKLLVSVHLNCQAGAPSSEGCLFLEIYVPVARVDPIPGGFYGVAVTFSSSVLF